MDFRLSPTKDPQALGSPEARAEFLVDWQRWLHAAGYVGLHWPITCGGRGPAIMVHGTEAQKRFRLPRILAAERVLGLPKD